MSSHVDGDEVSSWASEELEAFLKKDHAPSASSSNTGHINKTSTRPTSSTQMKTDDEISSWNSDELADFMKKDHPRPAGKSAKHKKKKGKQSNKRRRSTATKNPKQHDRRSKKSKRQQRSPSSSSTTPNPSSARPMAATPSTLPSLNVEREPSPWRLSSDSMAPYNTVHPTIMYSRPKRACAKMLVRAGYRCRCHFKLMTECPFDSRFRPDNSH